MEFRSVISKYNAESLVSVETLIYAVGMQFKKVQPPLKSKKGGLSLHDNTRLRVPFLIRQKIKYVITIFTISSLQSRSVLSNYHLFLISIKLLCN